MVSTLLVWYFDIKVETIQSQFGRVPNSLPSPQYLNINLQIIRKLFSAAMTIAFLGAIESLLSAVVADGMLGTRHRSNMELVAQGLGNIRSGGRTPIAAMTHSVVLLLIMLLFGKFAGLIPMPTLAAILIYVAYNMSEIHTFIRMLKAPKSDVTVLLITFTLTVVLDLTVAIEVGVVLSSFLFLQRMESVSRFDPIIASEMMNDDETNDINPIYEKIVPKGVEVFELFGPLFFGVAERFKSSITKLKDPPKVLILRMRNVPAIDASGIHALEDVLEKSKYNKNVLLLTGLQKQPKAAMTKSGFLAQVGEHNIFATTDEALNESKKYLS